MPIPDFNTHHHEIAFDDAKKMEQSFNVLAQNELAKSPANAKKLPVAEIFNAKAVINLLSQTGVVGLRITPAINTSSQIVFLLTAVDGNGKRVDVAVKPAAPNNTPADASTVLKPGTTASKVLEEGTRVPPYPNAGL